MQALFVLPTCTTSPLQIIQNAAARVIFGEPEGHHPTVYISALASTGCPHQVQLCYAKERHLNVPVEGKIFLMAFCFNSLLPDLAFLLALYFTCRLLWIEACAK